MQKKEQEALTPLIVEDHLDSIELLRAYIAEVLAEDDLESLKLGLETAAKAKVLRDV
jgi:hypothetical protein